MNMKDNKSKQTETDDLPTGWTETTLSEVAEPISKTHRFPNKDKIIFINTGDILAGKILHKNYSRISTLPGQAKKMIARDNILFSEIRPMNKRYAFVDFDDTADYVVSTKLMVIRAKENILPEFLYRVLISNDALSEFQHIAESRSGTFPQITFDAISHYPVVLPAFKEQRAIAKILFDLDEKIELNHQLNKTLEAIGQALFKRWFVDFEFPDDHGRHYKSSGGKMLESQLDEIPEGWGVKPLDAVAEFLNGLALQKFPPKGDEYLPVIKIRELNQGITESTDKAAIDIDKAYIVEDGDVLFSWSGSLQVCIWCEGRGALNQHLFKVTSPDYPKWFYYQWVKFHLPEFQQIAQGKATTMGHIQRHHLSAALVTVPKTETLENMSRVMSPIIDQIIINSVEVRRLSEIRDSLLPKLMSGQIRIGNLGGGRF